MKLIKFANASSAEADNVAVLADMSAFILLPIQRNNPPGIPIKHHCIKLSIHVLKNFFV
jgi:hypothetical protein